MEGPTGGDLVRQTPTVPGARVKRSSWWLGQPTHTGPWKAYGLPSRPLSMTPRKGGEYPSPGSGCRFKHQAVDIAVLS